MSIASSRVNYTRWIAICCLCGLLHAAQAQDPGLNQAITVVVATAKQAEAATYAIERNRYLDRAGITMSYPVAKQHIGISHAIKVIRSQPGFAWTTDVQVADAILAGLILHQTAGPRMADAAAQAKRDEAYERTQRQAIQAALDDIARQVQQREQAYAKKHEAHRTAEAARLADEVLKAEAAENETIRRLVEEAVKGTSTP